MKTGRTHLQDATPIRLGQEFAGYAGQAERAVRRLRQRAGGAVGGRAGRDRRRHRRQHPPAVRGAGLRAASLASCGLAVRETDNHFQAQNTLDAVLAASGSLRSAAVSLMKIANDIRWLGSGPRAGLGELALPEVQPGSSIMPGKVNPVIAESLIQVCRPGDRQRRRGQRGRRRAATSSSIR